MESLGERKSFWNKNYTKLNNERNSTIYLDENLKLFRDKNVFEIGPGEGRQFVKVYPLSKTYSIADISSVVLDLYYDKDVTKFLIKDFKLPKKIVFDIIHFWYVIHHLKIEELYTFFSFLSNHLEQDGIIMFNFPNYKKYRPEVLKNDGKKTSPIKKENIEKLMEPFFSIKYMKESNNSAIDVLAKKK